MGVNLYCTTSKDTSISKLPIKNITVTDLITFFRSITKDGLITRKRFNDGKSILNGIYYYAIEQGYIENNPLRNINYRNFTYKPINDVSTVYTLEERQRILNYLSYEDSIYSLAIQFNFHIVARIGELKSLKWSDLNGDKLRIQTQLLDNQTMNDDLSFNRRIAKDATYIKGQTSHGYRNMPLTPNALEILEKTRTLNPNGKYIFIDNNRPLTTITFNRHLKKAVMNLAFLIKAAIRYVLPLLLFFIKMVYLILSYKNY